MQELAQADLPYERVYFFKGRRAETFRANGRIPEVRNELINQEKAEPVFSAYRTGKFLDFCRGPHIPSTGRIKAFKLLSVAGAHWKGDESIPHPLQRIYGTAFFSKKKELDEFIHPAGRSEEARPPAALARSWISSAFRMRPGRD